MLVRNVNGRERNDGAIIRAHLIRDSTIWLHMAHEAVSYTGIDSMTRSCCNPALVHHDCDRSLFGWPGTTANKYAGVLFIRTFSAFIILLRLISGPLSLPQRAARFVAACCIVFLFVLARWSCCFIILVSSARCFRIASASCGCTPRQSVRHILVNMSP